MRVLDLFSGLGGWSQAFADRGHDVTTVDIEPSFRPTVLADIRTFEAWRYEPFDVVLASPPCEAFSVLQIGRNWHAVNDRLYPKTPKAEQALTIVQAALDVINDARPVFWVMENPRAALRKLPEVSHLERRTVTYCQYGETRMKPTDLWSDRWDAIPLTLLPTCNNGDPCHVSAPRGSRTGTQGYKDAPERAKVPYALSLAVCIAAEQSIN